MPFVRPITLYALQLAAVDAREGEIARANGYSDDIDKGLATCPVCGEVDCDEDFMMVDDYMFHRSTYERATAMTRADEL